MRHFEAEHLEHSRRAAQQDDPLGGLPLVVRPDASRVGDQGRRMRRDQLIHRRKLPLAAQPAPAASEHRRGPQALTCRIRRRSRPDVPPQTPETGCSGALKACSRHSGRTAQPAQIARARPGSPPFVGKKIAVPIPRHGARACHAGRVTSSEKVGGSWSPRTILCHSWTALSRSTSRERYRAVSSVVGVRWPYDLVKVGKPRLAIPCPFRPERRQAEKEGPRFRGRGPSACFGCSVADLSPEDAEILRRSIAMLPPQAPSGLSRVRALAILRSTRAGATGATAAISAAVCLRFVRRTLPDYGLYGCSSEEPA